jgi:hypothetical protein
MRYTLISNYIPGVAMVGFVATITPTSVERLLAWTLASVAGLTGTLMIAVGMFEELAGIFRTAWSGSLKPH